jgi:hypothetical protein
VDRDLATGFGRRFRVAGLRRMGGLLCWICLVGPHRGQAQDPYAYEFFRVQADTNAGFLWPYYLTLPKSVHNRTTLWVESNNLDTNAGEWHAGPE